MIKIGEKVLCSEAEVEPLKVPPVEYVKMGERWPYQIYLQVYCEKRVNPCLRRSSI